MTLSARSFALALAPALALTLSTAACAQMDGADHDMMSAMPLEADGPVVYIANLHDGQVVSSPVRVMFGLSGMGVAPAGVDKENTGHHHLLIDTTEAPVGAPLPAIPGEVVHFGGGQTEAVIELPPGEHTLMLVLADLNHVPFDPSIQSEPITITVQ